MQRAAPPAGSKSPLEFDAYTLNHAAFVGMNEVAWTIEFEQELTRREVFVEKNSASANHFAFFKTKEKARKMADDAMISISGSQVRSENFAANVKENWYLHKCFTQKTYFYPK